MMARISCVRKTRRKAHSAEQARRRLRLIRNDPLRAALAAIAAASAIACGISLAAMGTHPGRKETACLFASFLCCITSLYAYTAIFRDGGGRR